MDSMYERIKALRIASGMSQSELAKKTGYADRSSIAKIESGVVDISQTKIQLFADALGTTVRYLMDGDETNSTVSVTSAQRRLLDAAKGMKPEDLELAIRMIEALKK